jgi:uncharacterized protein (DUF1778 family)
MGIEHALAQAAKAKRPGLLDKYLATLDTDDAAKLIEAIHDPLVPTNQIVRAMNSEGMPITPNTIHDWRRLHVSS